MVALTATPKTTATPGGDPTYVPFVCLVDAAGNPISSNGGLNFPSVAASPTTGQIAVGTTATQILVAGRTDQFLVLKNIGNATIFLGGSGVTTANGHPLLAGESLTFDVKICNGAIFGIVATGSQTISFLRF